MDVLIHKCLRCGGGVKFDPTTSLCVCEFCKSQYTQEELEENEQTDRLEANFYECPSCAAEIMTDLTTAATHCYYCRQSVVLSNRLIGDFKPDGVIPFTIEKKAAIDGLAQWIGKKWFIPKDFFSENQVEKVTGIYFPFWYVDCNVTGDITAQGTKVRTWSDRTYNYTETKFYNIARSGKVKIKNIPKNALNKEESQLYEKVLPFDEKKAVNFKTAYLSGFQAEKRNIEKSELKGETKKEAKKYAKQLLSDTINGYHTVSGSTYTTEKIKMKWKYTLLPVWTLTYQDHDKTYFYVMNGQTGNINGSLPVDRKKLGLVSVLISVASFAIIWIVYGGMR